MKLISSLLVAGLLTGCACYDWKHPHSRYYKVTSADFEGKRIAEWVCDGQPIKVQDGFHIWAMQRRIFKPHVLEFHYPFGRWVTINASNIIITPVPQPLWLARLECGETDPKIVDPLDP